MHQSSLWQRFLSTFKTTPDEQASCFWQVDIHSHLLPGLDDGVKDEAAALACLTKLASWGIQKVITTPHVSRDWYPNSSASIRDGLATLEKLIADNNLPLTVGVAAEYLLDDFFPGLLSDDDLLCFGDKRYLLIETGWASAPNHLDSMLFRIQTKGYTPVLAHPERYKYYHEHRDTLLHLREAGCLFQLNWMSLTGRYGPGVERQARYLLKQHWVDFIGSDLHQPRDLADMARLFSSSDFHLLHEQPLLNESLL
jgi:tyrosine-protein phosphatase YwqE